MTVVPEVLAFNIQGHCTACPDICKKSKRPLFALVTRRATAQPSTQTHPTDPLLSTPEPADAFLIRSLNQSNGKIFYRGPSDTNALIDQRKAKRGSKIQSNEITLHVTIIWGGRHCKPRDFHLSLSNFWIKVNNFLPSALAGKAK